VTEAPAPPRRRLLLKTVVGTAVTVLLFAILLRYVHVSELVQLFSGARFSVLGLGFGLWLALYAMRALRFNLLAPRTPYSTMLAIASVHNFLLRLLPFRTGDLSYAFLVRRSGTAGLGESLIGLLLLRVLDSTTVIVIFVATLALDQSRFLGDRRAGMAFAVLAAALGVAVTLLLKPLLRLAFRVAERLARVVGLERRPVVRSLLDKVRGAIDDFAQLRLGIVLRIALVSVAVWLLTFTAFFAIMQAFSMPVSLAQTVLGSTAAVVTAFLPVGGIGSFGTLEAGWALGFVLVGLDKARAVASGFGVSITTFLYAAVLGLLGWLVLLLTSRSSRRAGPPDPEERAPGR
jgi:glycosyltransferase 2 family protein